MNASLLTSTLICLATLAATTSTQAEVNLQQASYYKTWTDFTVENKNLKYSFQRTYRSRSIHQGLFGFGWCTDFEKNLEIISSQEIILNDCQEERALLFRKVGKDYISTLNSKDKIISAADQFQRQKGLMKQIFNSEGRLMELKYYKWPLEIFYGASGKISHIKINKDQMIYLKFTPWNGDLLTVTAPGKAAFVYKFKDKNLITISSISGPNIQYEYNWARNLIRIQEENKAAETMSYDNSKDWLIETSSKPNCKKFYTYNFESTKKLFFKTAVETKCSGQVQSQILYTYELQENLGGSYRVVKTFSKNLILNSRIAVKNGVTNE